MTIEFPGVVPQLVVDRSASVPLGLQLQDALRRAVRAGDLRAGERLPSTRHLAQHLSVSRGLVVSAYEQLLSEGYLASTVGSGTRVASGWSVPASTTGSEPAPTAEPPAPRPRIDFGYGVPDLRSFPTRDWLWALGDAIRSVPTTMLGDGPIDGDPHLREVLAAYHRRVRAGCADPTDTIVVGGFREGLNFALRALVAHGIGRIALEDPGPRDHDRIARRAGLQVAAVGVDEEGLRVEQLRASGARAVLLTPAHQCPTGAVLSPDRRRDLVRWAQDVDGVILEDDYDAEFRYDRRPAGSLQGLAPDRVIAMGSVSKTLAPALRIGWVFAPRRFADDLRTEKYLSGRGVPHLDQAALARLMESGRFDRHLRKVRAVYRRRRDALVEAVVETMAGTSISGLDAGQHLLLRLPPTVDEQRLVAAAHAAGIAVRGLGDYRVTPDDNAAIAAFPPALVIGFGTVTTGQIREGIEILGRLAHA